MPMHIADPLLAQYFSQKDKILVVFGYLKNDHGRNWLILVTFGHFARTIVFLQYLSVMIRLQ